MVYAIAGGFIVIDFATGLIKAFKEKSFNSSVMREGLFHKCAYIFYVTFGVLIDYAQGFLDLGVTVPITKAIIAYVILTESGSILENLGKINPKIVPDKIKTYFKKLN